MEPYPLSRAGWRKSSHSNGGEGCIEVTAWRTSSHSSNGGDCVEVGVWNTSSHSTNGGNCVEVGVWSSSSHSTNGGECVEVTAQHQATSEIIIAVRDSKDREGPRLHFSAADWAAFCYRVRTSALTR